MISKGRSSIMLEDILKDVTELQILRFYFRVEYVPCVINSPLRIDNRPSFGLHEEDGKVRYRDFSTGDTGGIMDMLEKFYCISFEDALLKVFHDIPEIRSCPPVIGGSSMHTGNGISYSSGCKLECKVREWEKHDIDYWESYGISIPWLKFSHTYPISYVILGHDGYSGQVIIPAEKYAYAYVEFKDENPTLKIYQPYSKKYKWRNKHDSSVWDLWKQLPETGDYLIITSSRKDALCIWENTGIPSCSLQAESYLPKPHVVQQLKDRFGTVFVLYDNDFTKEINYGREYGKHISETFGIPQLELPTQLGEKDTSDLCKRYGREKVSEVIYTLIKDYERKIN